MAEAAEQQAKWTERQFWITAAEVTGLVLIVAFTAWTGRAAARSARAAEEAVRVASTTAKHQLRAYLFAEDANRVLNGETVALKKWQVHASIKNYGQTPAHNVVISTQVEVVGPDGDLDWNDLAVRQPIYMAPNEVVTAELDIDFSGRKFQQFTGGQSTVYFWGEISYLDVFGAVHHARFRMENAYRAGVNFAYCSEGNGST